MPNPSLRLFPSIAKAVTKARKPSLVPSAWQVRPHEKQVRSHEKPLYVCHGCTINLLAAFFGSRCRGTPVRDDYGSDSMYPCIIGRVRDMRGMPVVSRLQIEL
jgi:hypothetical protein